MTKLERFVWSRLRGRKVGGYRFRRQVPLGPYFADFLCPAARFVVEVDGEGHDGARDDSKTLWLEERGYRVHRVSAQEVDDSIDDVMDSIYKALTSWNPLPAAPSALPTSPHGGEVNPTHHMVGR
jgi:very-short-patch-repair endonuclease